VTAPTAFVPATVRAELLDCIQANLAVLADRHHGPDAHLGLGAALRFAPRRGLYGLPTVEPALGAQLTEAYRWLGLFPGREWRCVPGPNLADLVERHGTLYAIGDSYLMPWLPYHRRRHMEHSFLVEPADPPGAGLVTVTDAYHNQTAWGLASPGRWEVEPAELPAATLVLALRPIDGAATVAPSRALGDAGDYLLAYARYPDRRRALERLAVETWLLARSRKLHAAFLAAGRPADPALDAHLAEWDRVAGHTFLALRRVERGRPEPPGLLPSLGAVLAADAAAFDPHVYGSQI
jgi:hypothetical protein